MRLLHVLPPLLPSCGVTPGTKSESNWIARGGGGERVFPYKGLMGTCGQSGYVFRYFCLKQGIYFYQLCLINRVSFLGRFLTCKQGKVLCFKQGIKSRTILGRTSPLKDISSIPQPRAGLPCIVKLNITFLLVKP